MRIRTDPRTHVDWYSYTWHVLSMPLVKKRCSLGLFLFLWLSIKLILFVKKCPPIAQSLPDLYCVLIVLSWSRDVLWSCQLNIGVMKSCRLLYYLPQQTASALL